MSTTLNDRELLAAAEELCRVRGIAERDEMNRKLPTGWHAECAIYRFQVLVGGRPVDKDGNVLEPLVSRASGKEPETFYGPRGLVEAWALMQVISDRAATLGVEVKVTIQARAQMEVSRSWRGWEVVQ